MNPANAGPFTSRGRRRAWTIGAPDIIFVFMYLFLTLLIAALICGMGAGLALGCRLPELDARRRERGSRTRIDDLSRSSGIG